MASSIALAVFSIYLLHQSVAHVLKGQLIDYRSRHAIVSAKDSINVIGKYKWHPHSKQADQSIARTAGNRSVIHANPRLLLKYVVQGGLINQQCALVLNQV